MGIFGGFLVAVLLFGGLIVLMIVLSSIKVLSEYERGVIYRLGRMVGNPVGPGLFILWPIIDRMVKLDLRIVTLDVPPQDVITNDNVSLKVNAVVYYRVLDPNRAINEIEDYHYSTSQMAQTTLRGIVGKMELDDLLANRDKISKEVQSILDEETDPWGIKVTNVEVKHVDLPGDMQRAMARQAEAERERRAKIIAAEGEFQAAEKLTQAARMMSSEPMSLQMRYLQTMVEVGAENNSTLFFPIPIDIMTPFIEKEKNKSKSLNV